MAGYTLSPLTYVHLDMTEESSCMLTAPANGNIESHGPKLLGSSQDITAFRCYAYIEWTWIWSMALTCKMWNRSICSSTFIVCTHGFNHGCCSRYDFLILTFTWLLEKWTAAYIPAVLFPALPHCLNKHSYETMPCRGHLCSVCLFQYFNSSFLSKKTQSNLQNTIYKYTV